MRIKDEQGGLLLATMLTLGGFMFVLLLLSPHASPATSGSGIVETSPPTDTSTDLPPDQPIDLGTGFLVCVNLPGVSAPKTPALDARVARKLHAVRLDLQAQGISPLRFTYGFRSTAEQRDVNPGANYKAHPGTSPHEAGRAVDVSGMTVRPDRGEIVSTFKRHGWRWLGFGDPPHFEVSAASVGEPDRLAMIRKAQADYRRGNPRGCRNGARSPIITPSRALPSERQQRVVKAFG